MRRLCLISILSFFAATGFLVRSEVLAIDQMRMVDSFVGDSDTAVSSQINKDFTLYLGDNISPVTNPVKSVYFVVSGVYTGGAGSVELKLDSDAATSRVFSLPAVSSPTAFELMYKDPSGKINPTTAGTYSYQMNVIPTTVTIYGLAARLIITYRYAPAACDDGQPSAEKIKTIETFIGDSDTAVSAQVNQDFSIYIGDNISGVTNAIKSINFVVSGVYTGGAGSVELKLDSDAATSRVFALPVVTSPTAFELMYKDPSGKINPTTAGTYSYQMNVIPTTVTIYGLAVKAVVTYRYKPPTCGSGGTSGTLTSSTFDTTASANGPAYNSILWKGTLNGGSGKVRFQLASSDCPNAQTNPPACTTAGSWNYIGGSTCTSSDWYDPGGPDSSAELTCGPSSHNNQRYFRYKVQLCAASNCTSSGTSPTVDDVVVSWSP